MQVSLFQNAHETKPQDKISLGHVFQQIKEGTHRQRVQWVRDCWANEDKAAWIDAKKQLPAVTFSGVFSQRNGKSCTDYTGLVVADFDHTDDPESLRDALAEDEHCIMAFLSPSGDGVKAVFATDNRQPDMHLAAYLAVSDYINGAYALDLDESGKDVSRLCFLSSDPDAWCKEASALIHVEPRHMEAKAPEPQRNAAGLIEPNGRHDYLLSVAARVAHAGCGIEVVRAAVEDAVSHCDLSDGRVFSDREKRDIAESAVLKFTDEGRRIQAELVETRQTIDRWVGNWRTKQDQAAKTHSDPGPLPEIACELPGIGGLWMEYIRSNGFRWQPDLAVGNVLTACGCLTGKHLETPYGGRGNLYSFGLAGTGEGKDTARECTKRVLVAAGHSCEQIIGPEDIASSAGLVSAVQANNHMSLPILFQIDEAGYLISAASSADAPAHLAKILSALLKLYTSSGSIFKGDAYADTTKNLTIKEPHCSLWATTTPGKLWSGLTNDSVEGGLLGRCLFFFGQPEIPTNARPDPTRREPPEELTQAIFDWMHQPTRATLDGTPPARQCRLQADGIKVMDELTEWGEAKLRELRGDPMAGVFVRTPQIAERVALIYAWLRDMWNPVIDATAANYGALIARHSALRLAAHASQNILMDGGPFEKRLNRMLAKIRKHGAAGCSRRDIQLTMKVKPKELNELLDAAIDSGSVVALPQDGKKGARFAAS